MTSVLPLPVSATAAGAAELAVGTAAANVAGVSLAEVLARASLQTRCDRKYLVPAHEFTRIAAELDGELEALDIDGCRTFDYESQYFDTPGLLTYHEHRLDRSDRFKVRTRSYLDSGETMFEVKLEAPGGGTAKHRAAHAFADRRRLTSGARAHLALVLGGAARSVPRELVASAVVAYRRSTFVLRDRSERITCDRRLVASDAAGTVTGLDDHVLVEVKSDGGDSLADRTLRRLGLVPVSISKYCVSLALLHPELAAGPWHAFLDHFEGPSGLVAA